MKISIKQYAQALYEMTLNKSEVESGAIVENFVKELAKNNQLKLMPKIVEKFEQIYNENNGIVVAKVTSASSLDKNHLDRIEKYLADKYRAKKVILNNEIKPEIKGGVVLRVGDDLIDASITNQLRNLKASLEV